ncbi:nucleotidyltransferase domain-containing protein [candidate division WOR-3 bacterium]|nr:nucleotidyltransferase domain-containing protein [candidate division WOR-3 bacterium]
MLESLYVTKSKVRRDILTLFFGNPSKKYYVRQIERLLRYSVGSIARELKKFREDDLLLTEKAGNLVYYKLNQGHPLYEELRSIIMKSSGIVQRLKDALSSVANIDVAFIYGSYASGEAKASSDIDIMIIGDVESSEVVSSLTELEIKFDRELNFTLYTKEEFLEKRAGIEFLKEVMKGGKIPLIGNIDEIQ